MVKGTNCLKYLNDYITYKTWRGPLRKNEESESLAHATGAVILTKFLLGSYKNFHELVLLH